MKIIAREWALEFAKELIEAWNSHDLERILSHYADDAEISSPLVVERLGQPDGLAKGKDAVRAYWRPRMCLDPPLKFELLDVLVGVDQITLYYRSVGRRLVGETVLIDASGTATRGIVQWSASTDKKQVRTPKLPAAQCRSLPAGLTKSKET